MFVEVKKTCYTKEIIKQIDVKDITSIFILNGHIVVKGKQDKVIFEHRLFLIDEKNNVLNNITEKNEKDILTKILTKYNRFIKDAPVSKITIQTVWMINSITNKVSALTLEEAKSFHASKNFHKTEQF